MGTVLALPISGVISSDWGWEYAFYLFGSLTLVCHYWIIVENVLWQGKIPISIQ